MLVMMLSMMMLSTMMLTIHLCHVYRKLRKQRWTNRGTNTWKHSMPPFSIKGRQRQRVLTRWLGPCLLTHRPTLVCVPHRDNSFLREFLRNQPIIYHHRHHDDHPDVSDGDGCGGFLTDRSQFHLVPCGEALAQAADRPRPSIANIFLTLTSFSRSHCDNKFLNSWVI